MLPQIRSRYFWLLKILMTPTFFPCKGNSVDFLWKQEPCLGEIFHAPCSASVSWPTVIYKYLLPSREHTGANRVGFALPLLTLYVEAINVFISIPNAMFHLSGTTFLSTTQPTHFPLVSSTSNNRPQNSVSTIHPIEHRVSNHITNHH